MTKAALLEENKVLQEKNLLLEKNYLLLKEQGVLLQEQNQLLKEELAHIKGLIFGSKRERFSAAQNPLQSSLFDTEPIQEQFPEAVQKQIVKKKKGSRKDLERESPEISFRKV